MKDYFEMRWMHIIPTFAFFECIDSNSALNAKLCACSTGVMPHYEWKTNCSLSQLLHVMSEKIYAIQFIYELYMTFNLPNAHAIRHIPFVVWIVFCCSVNWVELKRRKGERMWKRKRHNNAANKNKFAHCFRNSNYPNLHIRENPNIVRQHNRTKGIVWLLNPVGSMPQPASHCVNESHAFPFMNLYAFVRC